MKYTIKIMYLPWKKIVKKKIIFKTNLGDYCLMSAASLEPVFTDLMSTIVFFFFFKYALSSLRASMSEYS